MTKGREDIRKVIVMQLKIIRTFTESSFGTTKLFSIILKLNGNRMYFPKGSN
jgi:hypothetical protein